MRGVVILAGYRAGPTASIAQNRICRVAPDRRPISRGKAFALGSREMTGSVSERSLSSACTPFTMEPTTPEPQSAIVQVLWLDPQQLGELARLSNLVQQRRRFLLKFRSLPFLDCLLKILDGLVSLSLL